MSKTTIESQQEVTKNAADKLARDTRSAQQRAEEEVGESRARMRASNEEAERRMSSSQPTPTQEENDLAKLGVPLPEKEDHGGENEEEVVDRVMKSKTRGFTYETREGRPAAPRKNKVAKKPGTRKSPRSSKKAEAAKEV